MCRRPCLFLLCSFLLCALWAVAVFAEKPDESQLREAARLRSLALAEMEEGRWGVAVEHLEALVEILPGNVLPPVNLAICYLQLDRPEAAREQIRRARQLDPDNPNTLYTLARLLELEPGEEKLWTEALEQFAAAHPNDPRPHYLAGRRLEMEKRPAEAVAAFERALERERENVVILADLLVTAAAAHDAEAALDALNGLEDRLDGFEGSMADYAERLRSAIYAGETEALGPPAVVVRNLLRPTELYQVHLAPLLGARQAGGGGIFPQLDFIPPLPPSIQGGRDPELAFELAEGSLGNSAGRPFLVTLAEPGVEGFLTAEVEGLVRWEVADDGLRHRRVGPAPKPDTRALHHDVDQDGVSDLVTFDSAHGLIFHPGLEDGGFGDGSKILEAAEAGEVLSLAPLEIDHDGDLDLFVGRADASDLYLQNNGDGTWSERAADLGLAGAAEDTTDAAVADFDHDGDLDLVVAHPESHPRYYDNRRAGALEEAAARLGFQAVGAGARRIEVGDFDGDGRFDLFFWGEAGWSVWLNREPRFEEATSSGEAASAAVSAAVSGDVDADGDPDVVIGRGGDLELLRNRGGELIAEELAAEVGEIGKLAVGDWDGDGDPDLVTELASGERRLYLGRGAEENGWVKLSLLGKNDNNAKNNTQGLFTRIEVRAGDDLRVMLGNGGVNHLGLGGHRQADVVRVVWTNGLAQTWQQVSTGRTLVEEQVLKGSCPFLYTWDGSGFRFVTDLMWKSPLGMVLADGSPAPHVSARDFVWIPGEALVESGGALWLQVTEELWEVAYVDHQRLLAIDRPVDLEVVLDEKFAPPPYPSAMPLHTVGEWLAPVGARDERGRDVLTQVRERDGDRVDDLPLSRYQGLTHGHALELDFEDIPAGEPLRLVLWGWTFPTDTSINVALSQDASRELSPPRVELLDHDGRWHEIVGFAGFPNGKEKAVVVELTGLVPAGEVTLRLPTTMQIYWDAAALAVGEAALQPIVTELEPKAADLHYRGYSRLYRDSPTGPHLFEYAQVSVAPRFRDLVGRYTRWGPVEELLRSADNRYAVMNAGDEMTIVYDARNLPPLPAGWRRDYVLYTDGWVKDGDLNTERSQTVEPLPYHGMSAYPDIPEHRYPQTLEQREYLERYQTREVDDRPFREAVKEPSILLVERSDHADEDQEAPDRP